MTQETPTPIRLVIGLGNPGSEYAQNRHNVGFRVIDSLAARHHMRFSRPGRAVSLAEGRIDGHEVALAKPLTYVNVSGRAAVDLVRRLKLDSPREMLVVCDDLDLAVGRLRVRPSGRYGGQKGLRSIIEALGTEDFPRIRIGIGRPTVAGRPSWDPDAVRDYVLSDPPPDERRLLDEAAERAVEAIECALSDGIEAAMVRFNG